MNDIKLGEHDVVAFLSPGTLLGALVYLVIFVIAAMVLTRVLRIAVHTAMTRAGHLDRTTISFLTQIGTATIWVIMIILYALLIPVLRSLGTALLAGASVASVVIGLAAQSTLGNLVAGVSITIYRPFRLGDTLQVTAPAGADIGVVELISLGYTTLRTPDGRSIVLPNSLAASTATVNLNSTYTPWPLVITMHVGPKIDIEVARGLALQVATERAGEKAIVGCHLTKVDASGTTLELRLQATGYSQRDKLRSELLGMLATRFRESTSVPDGEIPALS